MRTNSLEVAFGLPRSRLVTPLLSTLEVDLGIEQAVGANHHIGGGDVPSLVGFSLGIQITQCREWYY